MNNLFTIVKPYSMYNMALVHVNVKAVKNRIQTHNQPIPDSRQDNKLQLTSIKTLH